MDLKGKVALVTGGGSGIGRAAAELLAACGAKVGVLSRTGQEVSEVATGIEKRGGMAVPLTADVSESVQMQRAITKLVNLYNGLDIVFANAGINGAMKPLDELTIEDFDETVRTNLRGTFVTIKLAAEHLKKKGGAVVITSSINGNRTFNDPGSLIYSMTKAAQVAMAKLLALELAQHKVRVNVICPGSITTNIDDNTRRSHTERAAPRVKWPEGEMPLTGKREGKPEQVAKLVAFLCSDDADHITGTEVVIDGGQSLIV